MEAVSVCWGSFGYGDICLLIMDVVARCDIRTYNTIAGYSSLSLTASATQISLCLITELSDIKLKRFSLSLYPHFSDCSAISILRVLKSALVQVDYLIHVLEIKPWPPSQSLRNHRSVLIQWEHGERKSGSTNPVVPSLGSGIGDGKIEFSESFRLSLTLLREMSVKGDSDTFQKNCLEFNLYEQRRDNTVKGQLLGTAVIDFADYGILKESLSISAPCELQEEL
ncbi:hypothetical protein F0562_004521 [Nyssa sinensis]|uniref:C2 NT-type domain-containing protein n=1 Tax=Nyssa sinensis TaxID=561372 RepID=A0A5J5BZ22_9ASTE|nr:hypothetical protein F0562_004521 [Nyssa sinensis]